MKTVLGKFRSSIMWKSLIVTIGVLVAVAITVVAVSPTPAYAHAECRWVTDSNGFDTYECDQHPHYNTVLYTQPIDWCVYQPGDVVWKHTFNSNGTLVTDKWYVYHYNDPNALTPPACCHDGAWYVSPNGNCGLFLVW